MRTIDGTTLANLQAEVVSPLWLLYIVLDGVPYYFSSGSFDIVASGDTYLGNGYWQGIVPSQEARERDDNSLELQFSAVPSTMRELLISHGNQAGEVRVFLATMNDAQTAISGTPLTFYIGEIDNIQLNISDSQMIAQVFCAGKFSRGRKYQELRYTEACQKLFDSSDVGFGYVPTLEKFDGSWGSYKPIKKKKKAKR